MSTGSGEKSTRSVAPALSPSACGRCPNPSAIGFRSNPEHLLEADWPAERVVDKAREAALDCHHSRDGMHALQQSLDNLPVGELTTQSHDALVDKDLDI